VQQRTPTEVYWEDMLFGDAGLCLLYVYNAIGNLPNNFSYSCRATYRVAPQLTLLLANRKVLKLASCRCRHWRPKNLENPTQQS